MKQIRQLGLLVTASFMLSALTLTAQVCAPTAPVCVPGNGYAFRYASDIDFGLKFNTVTSDYEFTNNVGAAMVGIDANTGNIVIPGSGALQVGPNRYAFQFSLTPNYGLFFNAAGLDYEFRTSTAAPIFSIGANSGNIRTMGRIGVGTFAPATRIDVQGDAVSTINLINARTNHTSTSDTRALNGYSVPQDGWGIGAYGTGGFMGVRGENLGGAYTGGSYGVYGSATGTAGTRYGVYATSSNAGANAYGVFASAFASGGTNAYGIFATASGATNNWAGYFNGRGYFNGDVGIGTTTPAARLHVEQDAAVTTPGIISMINYSGTVDIRGVTSTSITQDGYGIGVEGIGGWQGVRGQNNGGAYTGTSYGVLGSASGTAGTRIGVQGSAFGGTRNYGVFSAGDAKVTGNLYIGTSTSSEDLVAGSYRLAVDGKIICEELKVEDSGTWPDYVFEKDYDLMSIEDLEIKINHQKHLPGIPSAAEVAEDGVSVGALQRSLVEKIEELTLYVIQQNKELKVQKGMIQSLQEQIKTND